MKRLALISTYCDTYEKIMVLLKNVSILKSMNVDVLVLSPIDLPIETIKKFDYYFQTKENPVLNWPTKAICIWKTVTVGPAKYRIHSTVPDHGWAGLYQTKILSMIGATLEYDRYYHMIYDLVIDDTVIAGLVSDDVITIYPYKKNDILWPAALHFMVFDRSHLLEFSRYISLSNYLSDETYDAFSWLYALREYFPFKLGPKPVEDQVDYYQKVDVHNFSPVSQFKLFIEKDDFEKGQVRLLLYDYTVNCKVKIIVDNVTVFNSELIEFGDALTYEPIGLGFSTIETKSVKMEVDGTPYDLTDTIRNITHSKIETING